MKKSILILIAASSIIACKKTETSSSYGEPFGSDSATVSTDTLKPIHTPNVQVTTAVIEKIDSLKEEKKLLTEKVAKEIDSTSKALIVSEIKTTQKKIDSIKSKVITAVNKSKAAPKVIRETKVIYKEAPKTETKEPVVTSSKKGTLDINVDDMETARAATKQQIAKYDGVIKTEQISENSDAKTNYLKVRIPSEKSDYLIEDLGRYVGTIGYRNIEIIGQENAKNTVCDLEITLTSDSQKAVVPVAPESFGGKMTAAFSSGWNVIQEIFLFILPFWPAFLIGGGIFYYFKKKKNAEHNA
ncbi:DUF4349 domain-containing protein [Elizabethkingia meningoseptica]|uniref:DUF4349 domain-containing protein n=1 Tax=Elizabethkingia meningoseptica TaxID=238 RepID=UPI0023B02AEE|nr:DUF4349 domain-containing protein [Elizabethkingia meningoseptica]MDE5431671.1 DUF4349 domain-containing protein [Elizabethkingia meningoseptica]